jgi:hypothetical protein
MEGQNNVTKTTTNQQIEDWKTELASAMVDRQWRRALQLCSWLRYALEQQECSDPEVEQMHHQAKEALSKQVTRERALQALQREYRRLQITVMNPNASGPWMQVLDSIAVFYQNGASQQEVLDLLQELKIRLTDRSFSMHRSKDPRAAALVRRFNEVLAQVRSDA